MGLKGSRTEGNLKEAFAAEAEANRRSLYVARRADVEGFPEVAGLLRDLAEGETGHAFGHLEFLEEVGDPVTGAALGDTTANLRSAVDGETDEAAEMYPGFARVARDEGFDEIADWFETLARAERLHASRLAQVLEDLEA
ncbi:MAG TPA: rubrerythrin family protein [Candidatus Dormibacteraeota bacterium]|nr:rubrerythrin family protein [Candidatus Dormibacteraeota bacterium]